MTHPVIKGLQEAQRDNLNMIRALHPNTGLGRAVQAAGIVLQRYVVGVTHVDTGTLRASHRIRMEIGSVEATATIYIDPSGVNPRSSKRAADYGPVEHARGEGHAFYERTYNEEGERAMEIGVAVLESSL